MTDPIRQVIAKRREEVQMLRIEYDDLRKLVNLMRGNECVDHMTLHEYEHAFGLFAAGQVVRR